MSGENDPAAVLAQHDPNMRLAQENASLRAQLEKLERSNVILGGFAGEAPRYQLNEPGYYDDTWFGAGTIIDYTDTPNLTMVPLNDPAKRRMQEHIEMLETGARRKAALAGRDYHGLVTDRNVLIDIARLDAQAAADAPVPVIQMPVPHGEVPAMPHTDAARAQAAKRGPGRPRKVISAVSPGPQRPPGADLGAPQLAPAPTENAIVGRMSG